MNDNALNNSIPDFIVNNLDEILSGCPTLLKTTNDDFWLEVLNQNEHNLLDEYFTVSNKKQHQLKFANIFKVVQILSKIFDYKWFISLEPKSHYSAYHLANNLNRRSCTYCNRTYTTTMQSSGGGKLMRPQFDHWFPKSKYPLLALSFYNLIPSCYNCNSLIKGDMELSLTTHIHPYIDKSPTDDFS